jgi:1-deoxyxylulose-5-phosphate synthase
LRRNPVVVAPIVGASKPSHLDDAVASVDIDLTDDEVAAPAPCTPRYDFKVCTRRARLLRWPPR